MNFRTILFIVIILLAHCRSKEEEQIIKVSSNFFIYSLPQKNSLSNLNFPMDLIHPKSKIKYFLHWERTGIWSPDQYAVLLEIPNISAEEIWNYYKNILRIKQWQILQSKIIKEKGQNFYFINALDFFNRNLSILIEEKEILYIKIYLKKLTDE